MAKCCLCERPIEREDAPVLSMGAVGNARLLCDDCAKLLDTATLSKDIDEITAAMDKIGKNMASSDPDGVTLETVSQIMYEAGERAKAIKDGSYDFSLDDEEGGEGLDDIPEDMLESEEDKEKDRIEEEKSKKFERFYNGFLVGAIVACALFILWRVLESFGVDFSKFFDFK